MATTTAAKRRAVTPACSAQYQPPYQYHCSNGHQLGAGQPLARCPVAWCTEAELHRVGPGSRSH